MIEYHQVCQSEEYRKKTEDYDRIQDNNSLPVHIISPCP